MKQTGIIMSGDHPKKILDGTKTMSRRVVTPSTSEVGEGKVDWGKFCWDGSQIYLDTCQHGHTEKHQAPLPFIDGRANENYPYEHQYLHVPYNWTEDMTIYRIYPKYEVGDLLWVRETWGQDYMGEVIYKADKPLGVITYADEPFKWKPSIHMPRWASRITLEITEVRVECLNQITEADVTKEGVDNLVTFMLLWDRLNKKRGYEWKRNCWVWVLTFKLCQ